MDGEGRLKSQPAPPRRCAAVAWRIGDPVYLNPRRDPMITVVLIKGFPDSFLAYPSLVRDVRPPLEAWIL